MGAGRCRGRGKDVVIPQRLVFSVEKLKKKWTGKRGLNPALRLGMHAGGPSGPGLIQIDKVMDSL
ncbi:hypothetical protein B6U90_01255 [Thermoplasmatales archaeon ex4484_6]|nr:MAG: hypothetical protein B6U90_01255 [Thermoplasmatales archaeon ex4484_6]RLF68284.1 MAG: hypothetical protein DRN57_04515 [Thermoplasmata archaeon]